MERHGYRVTGLFGTVAKYELKAGSWKPGQRALSLSSVRAQNSGTRWHLFLPL